MTKRITIYFYNLIFLKISQSQPITILFQFIVFSFSFYLCQFASITYRNTNKHHYYNVKHYFNKIYLFYEI